MQNIHHHSFPGFQVKSNNFLVIAVVLFLLLGSGNLTAEPLFEAKVFHQDTDEFLFHHYNAKIETDSLITLKHFYLLPDSTLSAEDSVTLKAGKIQSTYTRFPLAGEAGSLSRIDDKLLMQFESSQKQKERMLDFPDDMLLAPIFVDFIIENWNKLRKGKKVKITLPAPNVLKVAHFDLQKIESKYTSDQNMVIRMSVSSIFLKLFIGSSYFVFDTEANRLREIHGATILKTKKGKKWRNTTNASIYYTYPDEENFKQ